MTSISSSARRQIRRQLDPVPTWLVKDVCGLVSPFISLLFNKSLTSGYFPLEFKHTVVSALLKKSGLDASDLKMIGKGFVPFDSQLAISYRCSKSTSPAVFEIMGPKYIWVMTLTFLGHVTSSVT